LKISIPFVDRILDLEIPQRNLIFDVAPRNVDSAPDFNGTIRQALANPIGTPLLAEMLKTGMKVILICDDNTRVTPVRQIIPLLLEDLNRSGIPDRDIRIILASGTHRQMTEAEIEAKYGSEITSRVNVIRHYYKNPGELTNYGVTNRGIPVVVNRNVVEADFRIAVGNIVPHHPAGWAAGAKAVLPGVGGEETVAAMHLLGSRYPALGLRDSIMREEMEDFAEVIHLNFILNVILNRDAGLVGAVAGHFQAAHRAGVQIAQQVYGVPIPELADLTISSASPMDFDFFQGDKGITSAELSTRPGGEIVLVAGCVEGISPAHPELTEYVGAMSNAEIWKLVEARTVKDPLTAAEAIVINDIRAKMAISLLSRGIPREKCERLGITYIAENGLGDYIAGRIRQQPGLKIGILRHSADVLPLCAARGPE
jgi:nickel-dependent lactate racemase